MVTSFRRRLWETARCTNSTDEGPACQTAVITSFSSSVSGGRTDVLRTVTVQCGARKRAGVNWATKSKVFSGARLGIVRLYFAKRSYEIPLPRCLRSGHRMHRQRRRPAAALRAGATESGPSILKGGRHEYFRSP